MCSNWIQTAAIHCRGTCLCGVSLRFVLCESILSYTAALTRACLAIKPCLLPSLLLLLLLPANQLLIPINGAMFEEADAARAITVLSNCLALQLTVLLQRRRRTRSTWRYTKVGTKDILSQPPSTQYTTAISRNDHSSGTSGVNSNPRTVDDPTSPSLLAGPMRTTIVKHTLRSRFCTLETTNTTHRHTSTHFRQMHTTRCNHYRV